MKIQYTVSAVLFATALLCAGAYAIASSSVAGWHEDFSDHERTPFNRFVPKHWVLQEKSGVTPAVFDLTADSAQDQRVLHLFADQGSGAFVRVITDVDLARYPLMRWTWRVKRLPAGADARNVNLADQAVGIYLAAGRFRKESVGYRWDTLTPKGCTGHAVNDSVIKVYWTSMRNETDSLNVWHTETVDVAKAFQEIYGYMPKQFELAVICSSDRTASTAEAELASISFLPAIAAPVVEDRADAEAKTAVTE